MASLSTLALADPSTPTPIFELPVSMGPAGVNRRFVPRVRFPFRVRFGDDTLSMRGLDLSFGGLMCSGADIVWPGNTVPVELDLAGEKTPVQLLGRVVDLVGHHGETAMRVRFEEIAPAERKRIAMWMGRQAR